MVKKTTSRNAETSKSSTKQSKRQRIPAILMDADWSAFAQDNAKQMHIEETVKCFVPSESFRTLFQPKHQILLGSRGSGKTTWVRLLAHDHVLYAASINESRMDYAREALDRDLIGVYVPASVAFSGALRNKDWASEKEEEEQFVWRLNLHCCAALTHIIQSCAEHYLKNEHSKLLKVSGLCKALSSKWSNGAKECNNIIDLRLLLTEIELEHQANIRQRRVAQVETDSMTGVVDFFANEVLLPLRHAILVMGNELDIPATAMWMICLDEVEYLTEIHHRILNTIMRASSGNIVLKMATMPFAHLTLATNLGDPVREPHDFHYVYVNHNPIDPRGTEVESGFLKFSRDIFKYRFAYHNSELTGLTLPEVLGDSQIFHGYGNDHEKFLMDLKEFGNQQTYERAVRLYGTKKFGNEIFRKLTNVLFLRATINRSHGNAKLSIYSGEALVVRCCDGNPRRLVRVINSIIQRARTQGIDTRLPISSSIQNEVLEETARDILARTPSEPPVGALTAAYLSAIGKYAENKFLNSPRRLGSDQVSSVAIDLRDGEDAQKFIKHAVQLSLMTPSSYTPIKTPNQICEGVFHLAFMFSPLFKIFPRRNEAVRLPVAIAASRSLRASANLDLQQSLDLI